MTLIYPLSFASLADRLPISGVTWDVNRSDELSGTGDGRVWQSELANPLWMADLELSHGPFQSLKQLAAIIRSLQGSQESFWLYDPTSAFPQADPKGAVIGASVVEVMAVGAQRRTLRLKGLPPLYQLTVGDKLQIQYADGSLNFFGEFSESIAANGAGQTAEVQVFPHVPLGIAADLQVTLVKPACKVFVMPKGHNPGKTSGITTSGASLKVMERRR